MTIREIINTLEAFAPLDLQEDFDNAGVQVAVNSCPDALDAQLTGVLVCLDITEQVIDEAIAKNCNMVVSHHPLIFQPLKRVCGQTYQQRCVAKAILAGITLYSAHTNLDNAKGGVNYTIAALLGLKNLQWLEPRNIVLSSSTGDSSSTSSSAGTRGIEGGSGVIGRIPSPMTAMQLLLSLKTLFKVDTLMNNCKGNSPFAEQGSICGTIAVEKEIRKVALCGGAGAFLMGKAREMGADAFITGEIHYHDYFGQDMLLVEMGHYQSEQYTQELLMKIILRNFPEARVMKTSVNTNPVLAI